MIYNQKKRIIERAYQMDFIGAALKNMRMTAGSVGSAHVSSPWERDSDEGLPVAYYFLRGQGEVALDGQTAQPVEAGDLVFVPRGEKHSLRDVRMLHESDRGAQIESVSQSIFLYATIGAEMGGDCPFIAALPSLLLLRAGQRAHCPHLEAHLQSLVWEVGAGAAGSDLVLARLWEVVFLVAFRTYLSEATHHTKGWLAAARDPQLARALAAMQGQPHMTWTVELLAREAAMSRATFIRQFTRVMGQAPMTFLYLHRMGLAASWLQQGETLAVISARVGYGSEAAFSNAFRRHFGCAPGAYRSANERKTASPGT